MRSVRYQYFFVHGNLLLINRKNVIVANDQEHTKFWIGKE